MKRKLLKHNRHHLWFGVAILGVAIFSTFWEFNSILTRFSILLVCLGILVVGTMQILFEQVWLEPDSIIIRKWTTRIVRIPFHDIENTDVDDSGIHLKTLNGKSQFIKFPSKRSISDNLDFTNEFADSLKNYSREREGTFPT